MYHWPQDFVPLDGDTLWIRPDACATFIQRGWTTTEQILLAGEFEYNRSRPYFGGWDTGTGQVLDSQSESVFECHIKRFRYGFRSRSMAFRQADKVRLFQSAGIPCLDLIAVGKISAGAPSHPFRSFLISQRVGCGESIPERLTGPDRERAVSERSALLAAAGELIARMHAARIYHGDCKWLHLLLDSPSPQATSCRFIDLERARRILGPAALYAWIKDLEQCERSLQLLQATPDEVDEWYRVYNAAYAAAGGAWSRWGNITRQAISCRRALQRMRKPLIRAVQLRRRKTCRSGQHPLMHAKREYRARIAGH